MFRFASLLVRWQKKEQPRWVRNLSIVVTPPLFIFFVLGPSIFLYDTFDRRLGISQILTPPAHILIGIPIFIIGTILYTWTILLFARIGGGTQTPLVPTQKLVIRGPYAHSRNPMVLGVILFVTGLGMLLNSPSFIVLGLIIPLSYLVFIELVEEKELEARFGQDYLEYKRKTPFLLPHFRKPY